MRRPVCKRCGREDFHQDGEIEVRRDVTRKVESVTIHPDGSVSAKTAKSIDTDSTDDLAFEIETGDHTTFFGFSCECGAHEDDIADLVIAEPLAGDRVNLPDGRTAVIDETEPEGAWLRVHAAGEWWDFQDVEPWEPHPEQAALSVAA